MYHQSGKQFGSRYGSRLVANVMRGDIDRERIDTVAINYLLIIRRLYFVNDNLIDSRYKKRYYQSSLISAIVSC